MTESKKEKYINFILNNKEVEYLLEDLMKLEKKGSGCTINVHVKKGKISYKDYTVRSLIEW